MERWRLSCILHSSGKSHSKTKELFLPMENNIYQKRVAWSALQSEWEKVVHLGQCPVSHFEGYLVNIQKVQCKTGTKVWHSQALPLKRRHEIEGKWFGCERCRKCPVAVCLVLFASDASDASELVKASSLCKLRVGHIDPGQFGLSTSSHGYAWIYFLKLGLHFPQLAWPVGLIGSLTRTPASMHFSTPSTLIHRLDMMVIWKASEEHSEEPWLNSNFACSLTSSNQLAATKTHPYFSPPGQWIPKQWLVV